MILITPASGRPWLDRAPLFVPVLILKIGYGVAMLGLAHLLVSDKPEPAQAGAPIRPVGGASGVVDQTGLIAAPDRPPPVLIVAESEPGHAPCTQGEHPADRGCKWQGP